MVNFLFRGYKTRRRERGDVGLLVCPWVSNSLFRSFTVVPVINSFFMLRKGMRGQLRVGEWKGKQTLRAITNFDTYLILIRMKQV